MVTPVIKHADRLLGIKFWAEYYPSRIPRFDVFRFIGSAQNGNFSVHYFTSFRRPGQLIAKSASDFQREAVAGFFRPFCINHSVIESFLDERRPS